MLHFTANVWTFTIKLYLKINKVRTWWKLDDINELYGLERTLGLAYLLRGRLKHKKKLKKYIKVILSQKDNSVLIIYKWNEKIKETNTISLWSL